MSEKTIGQRVLEILRNDDAMQRMEAAVELRDDSPSEAIDTLISHLDSPDIRVRRRAGSVLSVFHELVEPRSAALVQHLRHSDDPSVRLSCAILLMSLDALAVASAFINALHDPFDKVAIVACMELGRLGGTEAISALYETLSHPEWAVRLEACKALIVLGAADQRVVSTLETMSREPEAGHYDTQIAEFARIESQVSQDYPEVVEDDEDEEEGCIREAWGTLGTILAEARLVAAGSHGD